MSDRVQFLCCAIAKKIFYHPKWGITSINDGLRLDDARAFDLEPLLMYALSIPGTEIRYINLSLLTKPVNVSNFLSEAWSSSGSVLRGYPDELVVSAPFAAANEVLINSLSTNGVKVTLPLRGNKQHPALLRSAQDNVLNYGYRYIAFDNKADVFSDYCMNINARFDFRAKTNELYGKSEKTHAVLALPFRPWLGALICEMGWINQEWLSSWEKNLPPVTKLWRKEYDRETWLFTQEPNDTDTIPVVPKNAKEPDWEAESQQHEYAMEFLESAKSLISCWPNRLVDLAKDCHITRKEIEWYLNGRPQGNHAISVTHHLAQRLNMSSDGDGYWSVDGGNAYIANGIAQTQQCYDVLSSGGDLEFSFEVLPSTGRADLAWRYLILRRYCGRINLIAFARGSREANLLDGDEFINLGAVVLVPASIYLDVVTAMREASAEVASNAATMDEFDQKHGHFFSSLKYRRTN